MQSQVTSRSSLALAALLLVPATAAADAPKYPLVAESRAELERLGFSLVRPAELAPGNRWSGKTCRNDGGVPQALLLAISDDVVARYAKRGFTRETLCLAIAGAPLYDPYTGKRLPTFVFRDPAGVAAVLAGRDPAKVDDVELIAAGVLTDEIPLAAPTCFRNGKPHVDCEWRYSERTGRQRTTGSIRSFARAGERLQETMADAIAKATEGGSGAERIVPTGIARSESFIGTPKTFKLPVEQLKSLIGSQPLPYAWFALGPTLPDGYGYALDPNGNSRRPSLSAAATEDKLGGSTHVSQIDADAIDSSLSSDD